jgi:hypothetical protein
MSKNIYGFRLSHSSTVFPLSSWLFILLLLFWLWQARCRVSGVFACILLRWRVHVVARDLGELPALPSILDASRLVVVADMLLARVVWTRAFFEAR